MPPGAGDAIERARPRLRRHRSSAGSAHGLTGELRRQLTETQPASAKRARSSPKDRAREPPRRPSRFGGPAISGDGARSGRRNSGSPGGAGARAVELESELELVRNAGHRAARGRQPAARELVVQPDITTELRLLPSWSSSGPSGYRSNSTPTMTTLVAAGTHAAIRPLRRHPVVSIVMAPIPPRPAKRCAQRRKRSRAVMRRLFHSCFGRDLPSHGNRWQAFSWPDRRPPRRRHTNA